VSLESIVYGPVDELETRIVSENVSDLRLCRDHLQLRAEPWRTLSIAPLEGRAQGFRLALPYAERIFALLVRLPRYSPTS
jgi:hypothetical protein